MRVLPRLLEPERSGCQLPHSLGSTMYLIIRHNEVSGHRYVHSDGQKPMTFQGMDAADAEVVRIKKLGATHTAKVYANFRNSNQAGAFCKFMMQGMAEADALRHATS